jgi:hypothetical protein
MKTAMQELLEEVTEEIEGSISVEFVAALGFVKSAIEQDYLEKEKWQIIDFTMDFMGEDNGYESYRRESALDLFNKTFNTSEK